MKTINKDPDIILLGPIKHEKLVNFYKVCDCLVLPSINSLETFGIVQAEAMVCGCPVVASNLPGVRVPVKITGMGEIAKVGNAVDLTNKIIKVLLNGKSSYSHLTTKTKEFDTNIFYNKYEHLFSN